MINGRSIKKKKRRDIKQEITTNVVEALQDMLAGKRTLAPWQRPFQSQGWVINNDSNFISKKPYRGINHLTTTMQGFGCPFWMTYKQATTLGGNVKKGAKGTPIVYWDIFEKENSDGEKKHIPFIRYFTVFNGDQVENVDFSKYKVEKVKNEDERNEEADRIISATGAQISYGANMAAWNKLTGEIVMPHYEDFMSGDSFYSTCFHELGHWTGPALKREQSGSFGSSDYAFEELVAEMTSAFMCNQVGIEGELQHESYIASWIKRLSNDVNYIFKASAMAQKACDIICPPTEDVA